MFLVEHREFLIPARERAFGVASGAPLPSPIPAVETFKSCVEHSDCSEQERAGDRAGYPPDKTSRFVEPPSTQTVEARKHGADELDRDRHRRAPWLNSFQTMLENEA
jgi:hypothetical protein